MRFVTRQNTPQSSISPAFSLLQATLFYTLMCAYSVSDDVTATLIDIIVTISPVNSTENADFSKPGLIDLLAQSIQTPAERTRASGNGVKAKIRVALGCMGLASTRSRVWK